jgi:hypothetical protein
VAAHPAATSLAALSSFNFLVAAPRTPEARLDDNTENGVFKEFQRVATDSAISMKERIILILVESVLMVIDSIMCELDTLSSVELYLAF